MPRIAFALTRLKGQSMGLRLAAVSFLNTVPLVEWFHRFPSPNLQVTEDLPSRVRGHLQRGEADIGLLPVFETLDGGSAGVLSTACIACRGTVDSVKVFAHGPLDQVARVLTDRGSRSSAALLKVLLAEEYGITPSFEEIRPDPDLPPGPDEAHLVIGDLCFAYEKALRGWSGVSGWDLGKMWLDRTGLPFVFATWAASGTWLQRESSSVVAQATDLLDEARDFGLEHSAELAAREAAAGRLGYGGEATPAAIDYYFRESLDYRLGPDHIRGIMEFHRLCLKYGLVPEGPPPIFL